MKRHVLGYPYDLFFERRQGKALKNKERPRALLLLLGLGLFLAGLSLGYLLLKTTQTTSPFQSKALKAPSGAQASQTPQSAKDGASPSKALPAPQHTASIQKPVALPKESAAFQEKDVPPLPPQSALLPALCERVVDGDTAWFQVRVAGVSVTHKVRFLNIDAPEMPYSPKGAQPGAQQATDRVRDAILGQEVYLEYDKEQTDRYGRQLCHIRLKDGTLFNLRLVEEGYARAVFFNPNYKYADYFKAAEKRARDAGLGIWSPKP